MLLYLGYSGCVKTFEGKTQNNIPIKKVIAAIVKTTNNPSQIFIRQIAEQTTSYHKHHSLILDGSFYDIFGMRLEYKNVSYIIKKIHISICNYSKIQL